MLMDWINNGLVLGHTMVFGFQSL